MPPLWHRTRYRWFSGARAAAAGGTYTAAFGAERAWQAAWLRERLALPS